MSLLEKIKDFHDLKNLNVKQKEQLACEIRELLLNLAKEKEIHLSSNLGIVELTMALLEEFDLTKDKLIYDTGHQTYVHKILTDRKDKIQTIRSDNGLSGLLDMSESIYDHYSPGHSGNSISVLEGMYEKIADENKLDHKQAYKNDTYFIDVIGDSSISNGVAFEALNDVGEKNIPLIIIVNDNGMSISKATGTFSKALNKIKTSKSFFGIEKITRDIFKFTKTYYKIYNLYKKLETRIVKPNIFQNLNFEYIGPIDGHNFKQLKMAFNKAKWYSKQGPVIVHIKTKKGRGSVNAELDQCGTYHSNTLKPSPVFGEVASEFLEKKMSENPKLRILNPAMNLGTGFNELYLKHTPHYYDTGIAEEHTVSYASGMSLAGLKVYVVIYSTFLQRAYDQLLHDFSRLNLNATFLIDRADVSGGDGPSHHGIFDIAYLKTMPNTTITSPRNREQFLQLLEYSYENNDLGIFCIRYPKKEFTTKSLPTKPFKAHHWEWLIENKNEACILTYGPYTDVISNYIVDENKNVDLINAVFINHYDKNELKQLFLKYKKILVYERIYGDLGLAHDLYKYRSENNLNNQIISMHYTNFCGKGSTKGIDLRNQMDVAHIFKRLEE